MLGVAHSICNLEFNVLNEIPEVFQRGSNYDYHFVVKELVNEFEGQFEWIEENKEKYWTFSVLIKKEVRKIDKEGNKTIENLLIVQNLWQVHYEILLIF